MVAIVTAVMRVAYRKVYPSRARGDGGEEHGTYGVLLLHLINDVPPNKGVWRKSAMKLRIYNNPRFLYQVYE